MASITWSAMVDGMAKCTSRGNYRLSLKRVAGDNETFLPSYIQMLHNQTCCDLSLICLLILSGVGGWPSAFVSRRAFAFVPRHDPADPAPKSAAWDGAEGAYTWLTLGRTQG